MADFEKSRQQVLAKITLATEAAGRPVGSCALLAVSKTFPASDVRACYATGQRAFGENYVQELLEKSAALADLPDIEWHFIGPLQSNKTRAVAEAAQWVHTVDRAKIGQRLSDQRPVDLPPLNVCVQVNVSGEESKSGCTLEEAPELAATVAALPRLKLRGLMCIPEPTEDRAKLLAQFRTLAALRERLIAAGYLLDTLSMGMSADLETAIAAGATMVRVGTALFGARSYPPNN
ncbi:MAG: YggS family pyridoxal phosphate-dependent enzyme [Burkholderiales bacterium]|nr:YggS family pyridoxal phosphate-dependent enzyme [Burkholderiales bacterium]